jgi:hypothetical protein
MAPSELLSIPELSRRWIYTREGIRRLVTRDTLFPPPAALIRRGGIGRTRLWELHDIEAYERTRLHLTDPDEKRQRQKRHLGAIARQGGQGRR